MIFFVIYFFNYSGILSLDQTTATQLNFNLIKKKKIKFTQELLLTLSLLTLNFLIAAETT